MCSSIHAWVQYIHVYASLVTTRNGVFYSQVDNYARELGDIAYAAVSTVACVTLSIIVHCRTTSLT